jgi:hypothetical protein
VTRSWSHQTVLDGHPVAGLARAFVRRHLVAHRMFHLVDLVSLVTVKLSAESLALHAKVVTLSLSQTDDVVLLRFIDGSLASETVEMSNAAIDEGIGSGVFGLLTLQWGVSRVADEPRGLWATFDAHRHKQQTVTTLEALMLPFPQAGAPQGTTGAVPGHEGRIRASPGPHGDVGLRT